VAALMASADADARTGEVLWRIRSADGSVDVTHGDPDRQFFLASATKLFVTAILAQLRDEGRLDWAAPLADYLSDVDLSGLFRTGATDRGGTVTVAEVMAHTAGVGDYFEGRRADGTTTLENAVAADPVYGLEDVLRWTRGMKSPTAGRGHYSDTGYQLLGAVIESVSGQAFGHAVQHRIAGPFGLTRTFCFGPSDVSRYDSIASVRNGKDPLHIPNTMASVQADGGIVSTLDDATRFLDLFFSGGLFPAGLLDEMMRDWHRIMYPLEYGTGVMRFRMAPVFTGLRRVPAFVGHSGATGTVLFRAPRTGLTIVGTVNQIQGRSRPYRLMVRCALEAGR